MAKHYFLWIILVGFIFSPCEGQNKGIKKTRTELSETNIQREESRLTGFNYFGEEPPGFIPKIFAPGGISSPDNYEFKITFTPDVKEIYFTRGIEGGKTKRHIMFTRLTEEGWTKPEVVSFSGTYMDEYPSISPDGSKLFFQSNRPLPTSWNKKAANHIFNLWIVERDGENWDDPYPVNKEANKGYCVNYIDNSGLFTLIMQVFQKL